MGADKLDADGLQLARNGRDQPAVIAFDVEGHATVLQRAGVAALRLDIGGPARLAPDASSRQAFGGRSASAGAPGRPAGQARQSLEWVKA